MSASGIRIRAATDADLAAAERLEQQTFSTHAISPRQMRYLLHNPRAIFLVATSGRELLGDAIGLIRQQGDARSGRIYSVVVADTHRGKGIGRKLATALVSHLLRRGVRRIYLEVEQSNAGAIHLYESLGFHPIEVLPHYYRNGAHGLRMRYQPTRR